ncbi:hypothetical protein PT2222_170110 [Paraburkholderia tropica]
MPCTAKRRARESGVDTSMLIRCALLLCEVCGARGVRARTQARVEAIDAKARNSQRNEARRRAERLADRRHADADARTQATRARMNVRDEERAASERAPRGDGCSHADFSRGFAPRKCD